MLLCIFLVVDNSLEINFIGRGILIKRLHFIFVPGIQALKPGSLLNIKFYRNGHEKIITAVLNPILRENSYVDDGRPVKVGRYARFKQLVEKSNELGRLRSKKVLKV